MEQNVPPDGWYHLWEDDTKRWAPFVSSEHFDSYTGQSFPLFKEQFGNQADVDNITVRAAPSALEALIPQGTVTVTAGQAVHHRTPKGMALLLSSPCVFVKETDKLAILDAACTKEFGHFSYRGNTSKKVIFCGETFTPEQIFKLLNLAEVKVVHFVSFAMKGSLQWAHPILLNLQQKMDGSEHNYRVLIDFAVTIEPQLCHLSQEGTHQCAGYDTSDRATQLVPLSMVDQQRTTSVFGSDTKVANYPSFCDAQFVANPSTPPLFGGSTIFPKATPSDLLEKYHGNEDEDEDEDADIVPLQRSIHCNATELKDVLKVVIYPNIAHLMKQHVGRGKKDVVSGATTVREASRVVNQLSKFAEHAMAGGVETGLRLEATVAIPNSHIFASCDVDDGQEHDGAPGWSLLDQFDFAFFPLWKAFHIQRIVFVPYKSICESMMRYYIFASLAKLPVNLQIMSGSNDSNQVGEKLVPGTAKYYGVQLAKQDKMVLGSGTSSVRNQLFYGKTTLPPKSNANGQGAADADADDEWMPSGEDSNDQTRVKGGRTRGSDRIEEATELKEGGRLSRELTYPQKCFLALYCANCGYPNKLANKLLARQFGPGPMAPDNSFIWIVFQVWTFYIQVLQTELHRDFPYTKNELSDLLLDNLIPSNLPRPAEAGAGELGMFQCNPPVITRPDQYAANTDDDLGDGEMYLYLHSMKIRGNFLRIKIGSTNPACLTIDEFFTTLWLMQTGGTHLDMYHCPLSRLTTAAIASTLSNDSVLTDAVLLAEVAYCANFKSTKKGTVRVNFINVPGNGDIPKTHGGAKFAEGKDIDDVVKKTSAHILDPTNHWFINKNNWKTYVSTKTDIPVRSAQEIYYAQLGASATEGEEAAWLLQKLETVLAAVLRIHRLESAGRFYYWAAFTVCSTPLKLRNTSANVISAVAKEITENDNLRKNWPNRLETEVELQYSPGSSNDVETELFEAVRSRALFQNIYDGDRQLDIVCTRYNPTNASSSWRRPYTIGRTENICARKTTRRLLDEDMGWSNWEDVIMPRSNQGFPYTVDASFVLRSNFTLPSRGYDIDVDENIDVPMEEPSAQNYLDGDLNIVNHGDGTPQGEEGNPLVGAGGSGAGTANEENEDDDNDDDPKDTWNPRLGGRQQHRVPAWQSRKRVKIHASNEDNTVHSAEQSNMSPFGDQVQDNNDRDSGFSPGNDWGDNAYDNGAKDDTTTICDGNSNEHMVSDNEDATSLENIETTGRSSWFAAFLASIDDFLKNDSTAVVAINGYQGRLSHTKDPLKDSTNGCFMISALAIVALLESGNNCCLSDDEINNIMDNTAPELLVQMRSALGMDRFSNGNISETFNFLYQQRVFSHSYFQAAVGGNILDEPTLHRLFTNIEKQNCAKVGVSLFFRGHVITIMKIDENYEIFDSLPVWDHAHSIRISMACEG